MSYEREDHEIDSAEEIRRGKARIEKQKGAHRQLKASAAKGSFGMPPTAEDILARVIDTRCTLLAEATCAQLDRIIEELSESGKAVDGYRKLKEIVAGGNPEEIASHIRVHLLDFKDVKTSRLSSKGTAQDNEFVKLICQLSEILIESHKRMFVLIARKLSHSSYRNPFEELDANIFLGVVNALDSVSFTTWPEVKRYIIGKFKHEVSVGSRRGVRGCSTDEDGNVGPQSERESDDKSVDNKEMFFDLDNAWQEPAIESDFDEEPPFERSQRMLEYLDEMLEVFNNPSTLFSKNFDYVHEYTAQRVNQGKPDVAYFGTDIGLSHNIYFNYVDGKRVTDSAWHVTGDVLGALVNAGRMLGKTNYSTVEKKLLSQPPGNSPHVPDYELALVQLNYAETLLSIVLERHKNGSYILSGTDPLSLVQIYELLGIIRAASNLYPANYSENIWDLIDAIEDGEEEVEVDYSYGFDHKNLQPLHDLIEIAVNAAIGFCNTGYSLIELNDDIERARTANENEEYETVERIYSKYLNRLHGFLVVYVIQSDEGLNLPNTSLKRKSDDGVVKTSTENLDAKLRKKLRFAVAKSLVGVSEDSLSLLHYYAD